MADQVVIAGAGDVGGRLARLRAAKGDEVLALRRRQVPAGIPGVRCLAADLLSGEGLAGLPRRPTAVVFCAAPDARTPSAYRTLFLDGVSRLLDAFDAPPLRFLFVSSTAVYGEDRGEWVDETTPPRPPRFNGEILLAAESALAARCAGAVVVRFSGLYGPGREAMLGRAREDRPGPRRWSNRIHVEDAAQALSHLLELADPGPVYLGSDDRPALECELIDWLRGRDGLPPVGGEGEEHGRRVRNARLRARGWRPVYPDYRAGYAALTGRV